mmetsp:Transcript_11865/g.30197  ORF Transcript_11865/g.30197 Transcript_11865/m.30197 type:complete len:100 (+) Transcript_11865:189-488(+)
MRRQPSCLRRRLLARAAALRTAAADERGALAAGATRPWWQRQARDAQGGVGLHDASMPAGRAEQGGRHGEIIVEVVSQTRTSSERESHGQREHRATSSR